MEEKKILFINSGTSFMVNAVRKNLKAAGFTMIEISSTLSELEEHEDETDLYVFFLDGFVSEKSEILAELREVCTEKEKMLVLLGNPVELETVEKTIPTPLLAARFVRPFDMQKLVDELNHLLEINSDNSRRKSILLVDDDSAYLKMVKGWLMNYYRVTIVTSGTQALLHLADNHPDLILLDYEMPVISGLRCLK
ncbi:MAG: response regulator [Schwartzia sp.]|nr:response regulator [Schwartzia sp. (in: firmicutes)]